MARIARKYSEVWNRIKNKDRVILSVTPELEKRVRKAVIKEKDKDTGFKVMNDVDKFYLDITYDKTRQELVFILKQRYGFVAEKKL